MGWLEGQVGIAVGITVGTVLGDTVGTAVGDVLGVIVGTALGAVLGVTVGTALGFMLGFDVVGLAVGFRVGTCVPRIQAHHCQLLPTGLLGLYIEQVWEYSMYLLVFALEYPVHCESDEHAPEYHKHPACDPP